MKNLKLKKIIVCLSLTFFGVLNSFCCVHASLIGGNPLNKNLIKSFDADEAFSRKKFFNCLNANWKDSKNAKKSVEERIRAVFSFFSCFNDFCEKFKNKKINYKEFGCSFCEVLDDRLIEIRKLYKDLEDSLINVGVDFNSREIFLKFEENLEEFANNIEPKILKYSYKKSRERYSAFVEKVEHIYNIFEKLKINLKLDEADSEAFFKRIEEVNGFMDDALRQDEEAVKLYDDYYFFDSILECTAKLIDVWSNVKLKKESILFEILNLNSDELKLKGFNKFVSHLQNWISYINENVLKLGGKHKSRDFLFLQNLKLFFNKFSVCKSVEDFDKTLVEFKPLVDLIKVSRSNSVLVSVCFGSIDWVFVNMHNMLEKIYLKIEQFFLINGVEYRPFHKEVIDNLKNLIASLKSAESRNKFVLSNGKSPSSNLIKKRLHAFNEEYGSILKRLCSINERSYYDLCKSKIDRCGKAKLYLKEIGDVLGPLKQKISKIVCFSDFVGCYNILKALNDRFSHLTGFDDSSGVLKKLSDLTSLCRLFVGVSGHIDGCLPGILENLNSKLEKFENNSSNTNFEYMQDIDLILSLFELIDYADVEYFNESINQDFKFKCYSILFDENSNISKFLNSFSDKIPYKNIKSYFKEPISIFKSEHSPIFFNLDVPEVETKIENYAVYNILKLKRLRIKFFDFFKNFKCKDQDLYRLTSYSDELFKFFKDLNFKYNYLISTGSDVGKLKYMAKVVEKVKNEQMLVFLKCLKSYNFNNNFKSYFSLLYEFFKKEIDSYKDKLSAYI